MNAYEIGLIKSAQIDVSKMSDEELIADALKRAIKSKRNPQFSHMTEDERHENLKKLFGGADVHRYSGDIEPGASRAAVVGGMTSEPAPDLFPVVRYHKDGPALYWEK